MTAKGHERKFGGGPGSQIKLNTYAIFHFIIFGHERPPDNDFGQHFEV